MVTGTKTFTKEELFDLFLLASKYNNDQGLLPITIADFTDEQADEFADLYLEVITTHKADFEPLGRKLKRVTDDFVEQVIDVVNEPAASEVSYNATTSFTNQSGNLLVGSGNPAGELVVATNGKLELGLGVRRHRDKVLPVAAQNVYNVELAENGDWIVVFSAGLLEGTTTNVTELYDVAVTFFGTAEGAEGDNQKTLHMTRVPAGYVWASADGSYVTEVTKTNADASVGQDILRYSFFPEVVSADNEPGTIVTGDFKIVLKAVHKKTEEVLSVEVLAKVTAAGAVVVPPAPVEPTEPVEPVEGE